MRLKPELEVRFIRYFGLGKGEIRWQCWSFPVATITNLCLPCTGACHLRSPCKTGSRMGKPEVLIKVQEMAGNAVKMRRKGKQRAKVVMKGQN